MDVINKVKIKVRFKLFFLKKFDGIFLCIWLSSFLLRDDLILEV